MPPKMLKFSKVSSQNEKLSITNFLKSYFIFVIKNLDSGDMVTKKIILVIYLPLKQM